MIQKQDLSAVHEYYTTARTAATQSEAQGSESIYAVWERGEAVDDSVTPSTYVPEYRAHMRELLLSLTGNGAGVFSLGCGNGFVEGDLVTEGRLVRAVDYNEEAVQLSRAKGVAAYVRDFFDLTREEIDDIGALYADGLLGHLFDPDAQLRPALDKLAGLELESGTHLVFSNDAPFDAVADFEPHRRVRDFWFLSKEYLGKSLADAGFAVAQSYYFPYLRPVSGPRNRTICVATVR